MNDSASHQDVKIACIQFDPQMAQKALNVERTLALIERPAAPTQLRQLRRMHRHRTLVLSFLAR